MVLMIAIDLQMLPFSLFEDISANRKLRKFKLFFTYVWKLETRFYRFYLGSINFLTFLEIFLYIFEPQSELFQLPWLSSFLWASRRPTMRNSLKHAQILRLIFSMPFKMQLSLRSGRCRVNSFILTHTSKLANYGPISSRHH